MGFSSRIAAGDNWGMGLLFVFFPDDPIVDFSSPSFPKSNSPIRRTNSNPILSKAQSTISICFLLVCVTLLLFTLSTFEPTIGKAPINPSRRMMSEKLPEQKPNSPMSSFWQRRKFTGKSAPPYPTALQGMGALYRRGTGPMSDLIVAHLVENVTDAELRLFLRLLHRSGLTAKSDLVLVFDSLTTETRFGPVIEEENASFLRLIDRYRKINASSGGTPKSASSFDVTQFVKSGKSEKEPLWGKRSRSNYSDEPETESRQASYGSVVGFDVAELDPENSLSGFMSHVPMSLRRWACYPMLLGRVKRNFKHTMLVDVKNSLILGDSLGRVRSLGAESVLLSGTSHGKKNSEKGRSHRSLNSAIIMGGGRGVRRLSSAMLTDIAGTAMQQHRKANSVTESGILSQLAGNELVLKRKSINLVTSAEPFPEVIHRGNGNGNGNKHHDVSKVIMDQICSLVVDSFVYRDC